MLFGRILFLFILSISSVVYSQELVLIEESGVEFIGVKTNKGKSERLSKKKLIKLVNSSKEISKVFEADSKKQVLKCIRAIKSRFISMSQINICKNLNSNYLNPEYISEDMVSSGCEVEVLESSIVKSNESSLLENDDETMNARLLYQRYHCGCNKDSIACMNKVYFCGNLYDKKQISKSYEELSELGLYDEMIGKSQLSPSSLVTDPNKPLIIGAFPGWDKKSISLKSQACYLSELSEKLPNSELEKVFNYTLEINDVTTREAPSYRNGLVDSRSSCKADRKEISRLKNIIKYKRIENINNKKIEKHDKEREIARLVNNISGCSDNFSLSVEDRLRDRPLPSIEPRSINPRDIQFPPDARGNNRLKMKSNSLVEFDPNKMYLANNVKLKPLRPRNQCADDLYISLSSKKKSYKDVWINYIEESKEELEYRKTALSATTKTINGIEKEIFSDVSINLYLKCKKLKSSIGEPWEKYTANIPELKPLDDLKTECNGYPESYERLQDDHKELKKKQLEEFEVYQFSKNVHFQRLDDSEKVLNKNIKDEILSEGMSLSSLFGGSEESSLMSEAIKEIIDNPSEKKKYLLLGNLSQIEKELLLRKQFDSKNKIDSINTELDKGLFSIQGGKQCAPTKSVE